MSFNNVPNENDPFAYFSELFGASSSNDPWETAASIASQIASENGDEGNVDPLVRSAIQDLTRVAELQVRNTLPFSLPTSIRVSSVTKGEWAKQSLLSYKPFFERFGEAINSADPEPTTSNDPMNMMMNKMLQDLGPTLVATSAGSMLGHLGKKAVGQYELPVPRKTDTILLVPRSIDKTAYELEVPTEECRLWVLLHEYTTHALLSIPHVQARLESLLIDFASAFKPNTSLISDQFGSIQDLSQIQELSEQFATPDAILSLMRSPAHDLLIPQLDALVATILGYVAHSMDILCSPLIQNHEKISEHFKQQLISRDPADHFMENLLGLDINENTIERGKNFIDGIKERAGEEGLARLWADELDQPTAAEVDAPGLWLERIGFHSGSTQLFEVPDDISEIEDL